MKAILDALPWQTTWNYVGTANMVPCVSAWFSNSFKDGIIKAKNCPTAAQIEDIANFFLYFWSNLKINFLETTTSAANDFHSGLPTPVRLLKYSSCFSWSRWSIYFVILLLHDVLSLAWLIMPLFWVFKQGVGAMLLCFESPLLTIIFFTHVFSSSRSYVVYHWLSSSRTRGTVKVSLWLWHV